MLFTINDLGFSIAGLLLEGWLAFAARCICALALLFIGWVVSRWLQKSLFPRLLKTQLALCLYTPSAGKLCPPGGPHRVVHRYVSGPAQPALGHPPVLRPCCSKPIG